MTIGTKILALIEAMAAEPGKNLKTGLLQTAKDTWDIDSVRLLSKVLHAARNPRVTYGKSYIAPKDQFGAAQDLDVADEQMWQVLDQLARRELSGNAADAAIEQLMSFLNDASAELFRRIIHRDLRAGFQESTINKVFKGLIKETPYMRCSLPAKSRMKKWDPKLGFYEQLKADGMFQSITRIDGEFTILSRSGETMPVDMVPLLLAEARRVQPDATRLEGELLVYNLNNDPPLMPRGLGNGLINSLRQGTPLPDNHELHFYVWDIVDLMDGDPTKDSTPLEDRIKRLESLGLGHPMHVAETNWCPDVKHALAITARRMAEGEEGSIYKYPLSIWEDGTSTDYVKVKTSFQVEVRITGFKPGEKGKKTEKTFGAFEYSSECGQVTGTVSGMSDAVRLDAHENREKYLNGIMTVEANDLTKGRDSETWALSHPRFIEHRSDKTVADTLEQMREQLQAARTSINFG